MKIGFLILNFNSWKMTKKLATKVATFSAIDEVLIVDNVSTDVSYQRLASIEDSKVTVVKSEKNGGYSYGNNFGVKILSKRHCDIIFISNPDVDVEEETIQKIVDTFKKNKEYAILSGIEYDAAGNISNHCVHKRNRYKDDLIECFYIGRKIMKKKKDKQLNDLKNVEETEIIKGSFFAIRTKSFIDIGGFDENVFLFCEERILSRKIANNGEKLGIVSSAKYYHNHQASINKTYRKLVQQIKLLYKSRLYYNVEYNRINIFQLVLLKLAMKISIAEYSFVDIIKGIKVNK